MTRSKKHHYVPKVLQRQFLNGATNFWFSEKHSSGYYSAPEKRSVDGAFHRRNLYTIYGNGKSSDVVERDYYGAIDDFLGKFLPEVSDIFRAGKIPSVEGESLNSARRVIYEMIKRTPDFTKSFDDEKAGREVVERVYETHRDQLSSDQVAELKDDLANPEALRRLGQTGRLLAMSRGSEKVNEILDDFCIRWAKIESKHSFVLSSVMAYRIGNGGPNGLINPNCEVWLPISPKISAVMIRDPKGKIPACVKIEPKKVREVNEYALEVGHAVASHSQNLLESLTGRKAKERRP